MKFKPEYVSLAVNVCTTLWYLHQGVEPGKIVYWLGTILIVVGLMIMKG